MKIAVSADERMISGHFGHCENYLVFEVENGKIINETAHKNPGHAPGITPPLFVVSLGVNAAIGGTIGQGALDIMKEAGIDVVLGVTGDAAQAAEDYLAGKLKNDNDAIKSCGGC